MRRDGAKLCARGRLDPLFRLPLVAFENSFPRLLAEAERLEDLEVHAISQYYVDAESFNRGLEFAQQAPDGSEARYTEVNRLHLKALHLMPGKFVPVKGGDLSPPSRYDFAMAVVEEHLGEHYSVEEVLEPSAPLRMQRSEIGMALLRFNLIPRPVAPARSGRRPGWRTQRRMHTGK